MLSAHDCDQCGQTARPGASFCTSCGASLISRADPDDGGVAVPSWEKPRETDVYKTMLRIPRGFLFEAQIRREHVSWWRRAAPTVGDMLIMVSATGAVASLLLLLPKLLGN